MMMKSFQTLVLVWGWSNQEGLEGQRRGLDPIGNTGLPIQEGGGGDAVLPVEDGGGDLPKGGELECGEGQFSCADDSKCLPSSWQDFPIVIIFRSFQIIDINHHAISNLISLSLQFYCIPDIIQFKHCHILLINQ